MLPAGFQAIAAHLAAAEQTVDFMISRRAISTSCPDNDVPRSLDERRMLWAIGDIINNRPALSRLHPHHAEAFAAFVKQNRGEHHERP